MNFKSPAFWWQRTLATRSKFLMPIGMIYGFITARRMKRRSIASASVPVICVGNVVIGGAGKTPTTISISRLLESNGYKCGFLLRGYGGSSKEATRVLPEHTADEVGDEALLYAAIGPTVVSADRPSGAELLGNADIDVILMDDGFQNPSLKKDCALIVVDAVSGWGNGLCFPAGPLRASLNSHMALANAVIGLGQGEYSESLELLQIQHQFEFIEADVVVSTPHPLDQTTRYFAYSGIGRPQKFFSSLEQNGYSLIERKPYPDHHPFSESDAKKILQQVKAHSAIPITTEKDHIRLASSEPGSHRAELFQASRVLKISVEFSNPDELLNLLSDAIASKE
ncbi:MAG: tetraacyldisaccharide 4'-kinase [Hyphomicrobiales bacterium]